MTTVVVEPYEPPAAVRSVVPRECWPRGRVRLAALPTRVAPLSLPCASAAPASLLVKHDDETGLLVSGNKVRKLEFLLAEALLQKCDCVTTVGGIQSNHCRATAAAARRVGLDCHLLLRTSELDVKDTTCGNLLLNQMVGATITLFTPEQRDRAGGYAVLLEKTAEKLRAQGKRPYVIPMGGSNALGAWGYIEAAVEIAQQLQAPLLSHVNEVVVACGSGGTIAGLGVGMRICRPDVRVSGVSVCDDAAYFHAEVNAILADLHLPWHSEELVSMIDGYKGIGYALSTEEELKFIYEVGKTTGVLFDPVYTGKCLIGVAKDTHFKGRHVLMVHTGGIYGLYEKATQLGSLFPKWSVFSE
eukprot:TRINITY_DN6304_c0_g1_i1.p1 TRINITY_DN6304_c0_g1~~TRINITY_DN6304_c0_g1_i1.p1  ORF type:complete len:358 (-),score=104.98 TRINITY_DN6304_c0_g1_i1:72-1145(-)